MAVARAHDVFVSYSWKDKSFVEFLVRSLERAGLDCFQDTRLNLFDKLDASLKAAIKPTSQAIKLGGV